MALEPPILLAPGTALPAPAPYDHGQRLFRYDPPMDAEEYVRGVDAQGDPAWIDRRPDRDPERFVRAVATLPES